MAGVAEKARFYLERSVPQLREWEEKEIFSKVSLRTDVPQLAATKKKKTPQKTTF